MIYRIKLDTNMEVHPKHFLLNAYSVQQVTRILTDYIGLEIPFEILGTIARIEAPYNKYSVLGMKMLLQTSKDCWVLTGQPSTQELNKHYTFITNEYRAYENQY